MPNPETSQHPAERAPGWVVLALALVAMALPLWQHRAYFDGEAIVYHGDAAQLQFPRYVTLCESLQRGDFPLWQTLVYGGSPFHANPENPTLYPPTLLLARFTTPVWTINGTILLHLALAALGAFLLIRRLGRRLELGDAASSAGALVGATIFALSHFTRRDHVNLVAYGAAHAWIPWMLLAADGVLHGERPRRAAGLLALLVAAIFLTGGLYVIPYAFLALGLWMLFLGLLDGPRARRRALRFGALAAVAAGLMIAAKLLPYREWLPTTNREGRLPLEDALATSLGGKGTFEWSQVLVRVQRFLGGWPVLLPGLLALPLLRAKVVRVILGLTGLGFLIGLGGWTWRFFYEVVPPFDQIRSAVRAWTLVNAFYPLAVGLGAAWLFARARALREGPALAALVGTGCALALVGPLMGHDPREEVMSHPDRVSELRERYPRWRKAAAHAGDDWRAVYLEREGPIGRNEQFATSLLGVETVAGYQGHVWPARLEQLLYAAPFERETRLRRLGVLSVRWVVSNDPSIEPTRDPAEVDPPGIEGTELLDNPYARPRLEMPAVVVGVVGWPEDRASVISALLDHPDYPIRDTVLLEQAADDSPTDPYELPGPFLDEAEARAVDLWIGGRPLVSPTLPLADVEKVELSDPADLDRVVARIADLAQRRRTVELGFERDGPNRALLHVMSVDQGAGPRDRFVVASEPWSWYRGWEIEGLDAPPTLRVADGIATAFLLPAHVPTSPLVAVYRPASFPAGLAVGALGLLLALGLVLVPAREPLRRAPPPEPPPPPPPLRGPIPLREGE